MRRAKQAKLAVHDVASLAPAALAERLRALAGDIHGAYAANTLKAWRSSWRVWSAFCKVQGEPVLPTSVDVLRAFLHAQIAAGKKRATLNTYLSTLAWVHRLANVPNPIETAEGQLMWRSLRRDQRLPNSQDQARPLTWFDIERILATLDHTQPRDVRDAALLRVAYETLMRISELSAMDVEHLRVDSNGEGNGSVVLPYSKTDQEGESDLRFVSKETFVAINRWVEIAGIADGALWRSVPPRWKSGGRPLQERLGARDIARVVRRRAARAGVESGELLTGHSTRVGAAQDLDHAGFTTLQIQRAGGWASETMVARYTKEAKVATGAMAQLQRRRKTAE